MGDSEHFGTIARELKRIADALENLNFQQIGDIKVGSTKKDEKKDKPIQNTQEQGNNSG